MCVFIYNHRERLHKKGNKSKDGLRIRVGFTRTWVRPSRKKTDSDLGSKKKTDPYPV